MKALLPLLLVVVVQAACVSTPAPPVAGPAMGDLVVHNTTDRCAVPGRSLPLTLDGVARGPLPAGFSASFRVRVGVHRVELGSDEGRHDVLVSVVAGGTAATAAGCGDWRTVGGKEGATLRLAVGAHACATGPHGTVAWLLDGYPLAQQASGGGERIVTVPAGTHRLEATLARVVLAQARVTVTPDKGAAQRVGCSDVPEGARSGAGLLPLTVHYAPPATCATPLTARMAGKELSLPPQSAYTVYVPAGRHVVALVGAGTETRVLKTAGSVVRRDQCIETPHSDPTGKKTP